MCHGRTDPDPNFIWLRPTCRYDELRMTLVVVSTQGILKTRVLKFGRRLYNRCKT